MTTRDFRAAGRRRRRAVQTCGCVGRAAADADARDPGCSTRGCRGLDRAESTTYSAIITPNAQVDLAFRVSGYVVDVRRTKGADGRTRAWSRALP